MKFLPKIFFLLLVGGVLFSCSKDRKLGKDTIDSSAYLDGKTVDTFELVTYTIEEDSIITDNASNVVLGSYNDPKFGTFDAHFYTQFRLEGFNPEFGDVNTIQIDSFVLALKYVGYYGDLSPQQFEVYEMNEPIYLDSTYYSFTTIATKPTNLVAPGKGLIYPKPLTKTVIGTGTDTDTLESQLRIPLDTNKAWSIINEAASGNGTFSSNENFLNYFKGICVKTNNGLQASGVGAAFYFDITNAASKATIYFKLAGVAKKYDLLINASSADFTHVDIENAGKPIAQVLQDSTKGATEFYAQAFKHRAIVKIKNIDDLPKNVIIHRADLILPVQFQTGNRYKPGSSVSAATKLKVSDNNYTNLGILGEFSEANKYFKVDARKYVQALVNNDVENFGVVISPRFFINSSERIVFNGKNTTNKSKPKLILTYTTY